MHHACLFRPYKCGFNGNKAEVLSHQETCLIRPVPCVYPGCLSCGPLYKRLKPGLEAKIETMVTEEQICSFDVTPMMEYNPCPHRYSKPHSVPLLRLTDHIRKLHPCAQYLEDRPAFRNACFDESRMEWNASNNVNCFWNLWGLLRVTWGIEYCKERKLHVMWAKAYTFNAKATKELYALFWMSQFSAPRGGEPIPRPPGAPYLLKAKVPVATMDTPMKKILEEWPGVEHDMMKLYLRQHPVSSLAQVGVSHTTKIMVTVW